MKKLLFTLVAGGALAVASMQVAQAQVVSFNFLAKVIGGDWNGTWGLGSFSYDAGTITGLGDEFLSPAANALHTQITLFGQGFNQTDDSGYDFFPTLALSNGTPASLAWWIEESPPGGNPTAITEVGVEAILIDGPLVWYEPVGTAFGDGVYVVQASVLGTVPEPSTVAFSAVAGLGLGMFLVRRRRMAKSA